MLCTPASLLLLACERPPTCRPNRALLPLPRRLPMPPNPSRAAACRATFDPDTIRSRLRELAFLNSRATIFFRALDGKQPGAPANGNGSAGGSGSGAGNAGKASAPAAADTEVAATLSPAAAEATAAGWEVFHYSGGLAEYVRYLNRDKEAIHEPFYFSKQVRWRAPRMRCAAPHGARPPRMTSQAGRRPLLAWRPPGSAAHWLAALPTSPPRRRMATPWRWRCSGAATLSGWLPGAGRGCIPLDSARLAHRRLLRSSFLCQGAGPWTLPVRPPLQLLLPVAPSAPLTPNPRKNNAQSLFPRRCCSDTIVGFVNSIKTIDGGTHIDGTKAALTRTGELTRASRQLPLHSDGCTLPSVGTVPRPHCQAAGAAPYRADGSSRHRELGCGLRPPGAPVASCTVCPLPPTAALRSEQPGPQDQGHQGGGAQPGGGVHPGGPRRGGVRQGKRGSLGRRAARLSPASAGTHAWHACLAGGGMCQARRRACRSAGAQPGV